MRVVSRIFASWNQLEWWLRQFEGLSQSQLAKRMKNTQSYIARIEGGKVRPSPDALERFAQATRTRLRIVFEPQPARWSLTFLAGLATRFPPRSERVPSSVGD